MISIKHVAIIGIQGLPANYGGFETMVENIIGDNCSRHIQYTVYCSAKDMKSSNLKEYKGAHLKYVNLPSHGIWSIPYYTMSLIKCISKNYDTILMLGCGGGYILPLFRKFNLDTKIIVNVDGIEWKREKWGKMAKSLIHSLEKFAVKYADILIADNKGIQDYLNNEYGKQSYMIPYGGDTAIRTVSETEKTSLLKKYSLESGEYAISVCRIEPENNCHITLDAFSQSNVKLVFVGNWNRSEYGRELKSKYSTYNNILLLDPIYNLDKLYVLRSNAFSYIHGHSAGGTNPSLVEAMFFGISIYAFDCIYNVETTQNRAFYYRNSQELLRLLETRPYNGHDMKSLATKYYTWKCIADQYERIY